MEPVNDEMPAMVRMRLALTHIYDHEVHVVHRDSLMKAVRECAPSWSLGGLSFPYQISPEQI
jgi:hypothetical protein